MIVISNHHARASQVDWQIANDDEKDNFKQVLEDKLKALKYRPKCMDIKCDSGVHL